MNHKLPKQDLDHQVWKLLKAGAWQDKKILVALSGGVDSLALLRVLFKLLSPTKLHACYVHHGADKNPQYQSYRDSAAVFCRQICEQWQIPFSILQGSSSSSSASASSEADYRDLRYELLEAFRAKSECNFIATGHHLDDLTETRLLRLVRGTGAQGLPAMQTQQDFLLRPFLQISKEELKSYLRLEGLAFFEDPSNQSLDPLRNWLRQSWLPDLESRQPGAVKALGRSLETIVEEIQQRPWGALLRQNESYQQPGLSRAFYLTLSFAEQRRLLAQYLFSLEVRDFSQAHLEEIQKRLDNSQKVITFRLAGCCWSINAEQIFAEPIQVQS